MSLNETDGIKQTIDFVERDDIGLNFKENCDGINEEIVNNDNTKEKLNDERIEENNLNVQETFNEIRQKLQDLNNKEKIQTRNDILYNLHRKIIKQREEIQYKCEVEKEQKELSECTFVPKIIRVNSNFKKQIENVQLKNTANENYVDKKKKQREKKNQLENQGKHKIGTGNNWTKDLTVPKDFDFKTQGNIVPSNLNNSEVKDHSEYKNIKVIII